MPRASFIPKKIFRIVVYDIMPTNIPNFLKKSQKVFLGATMIDSPIIPQSPNIMDFLVT